MDDLGQRDLPDRPDMADEDLTSEERDGRQIRSEQCVEQLEVSLLGSWF